MLIPVPPQFRKRRGRDKAAIGAAGLSIVSVVTLGSELVVTFSAAIAWDGSTVPAEFKAFTEGDLQSCINVTGVGADWVKVEFNADVDPGAAWALDGPMAGITPAIAWPQNGTVIP